jgi:hypothetical protein
MLAASLVGIFLIPALYVTFQWLRERAHRLAGIGGAAPAPEAASQPATPAGHDKAAQ